MIRKLGEPAKKGKRTATKDKFEEPQVEVYKEGKDTNFEFVNVETSDNDTIILPKDTFDKLDMSVEKLKYAWEKKDLDKFLRKVWKPNPNDYYKLYFLTSQGWLSGKTSRGDKLNHFADYSNLIDSDRNFVKRDDERIYAIHIAKL